jgi:hypothetical protein
VTCWFQIGYNNQMSEYKSWKGPEGYLRAVAIRDELRHKFSREPTKRDFREAGKYNVWMALYRHGRKSSSNEEQCEKMYMSIREGLLNSKRLMEKMVGDVLYTLGPYEVENIVERSIKKRW